MGVWLHLGSVFILIAGWLFGLIVPMIQAKLSSAGTEHPMDEGVMDDFSAAGQADADRYIYVTEEESRSPWLTPPWRRRWEHGLLDYRRIDVFYDLKKHELAIVELWRRHGQLFSKVHLQTNDGPALAQSAADAWRALRDSSWRGSRRERAFRFERTVLEEMARAARAGAFR